MDGNTHRAARAASLATEADEQSASRMTEELEAASLDGGGGWKLENLSARKAENGGVIVTCSKRRERTSEKQPYEDTYQYQSKDYVFTTVDDALAYIGQELGTAAGGTKHAEVAPGKGR